MLFPSFNWLFWLLADETAVLIKLPDLYTLIFAKNKHYLDKTKNVYCILQYTFFLFYYRIPQLFYNILKMRVSQSPLINRQILFDRDFYRFKVPCQYVRLNIFRSIYKLEEVVDQVFRNFKPGKIIFP